MKEEEQKRDSFKQYRFNLNIEEENERQSKKIFSVKEKIIFVNQSQRNPYTVSFYDTSAEKKSIKLENYTAYLEKAPYLAFQKLQNSILRPESNKIIKTRIFQAFSMKEVEVMAEDTWSTNNIFPRILFDHTLNELFQFGVDVSQDRNSGILTFLEKQPIVAYLQHKLHVQTGIREITRRDFRETKEKTFKLDEGNYLVTPITFLELQRNEKTYEQKESFLTYDRQSRFNIVSFDSTQQDYNVLNCFNGHEPTFYQIQKQVIVLKQFNSLTVIEQGLESLRIQVFPGESEPEIQKCLPIYAPFAYPHLFYAQRKQDGTYSVSRKSFKQHEEKEVQIIAQEARILSISSHLSMGTQRLIVFDANLRIQLHEVDINEKIVSLQLYANFPVNALKDFKILNFPLFFMDVDSMSLRIEEREYSCYSSKKEKRENQNMDELLQDGRRVGKQKLIPLNFNSCSGQIRFYEHLQLAIEKKSLDRDETRVRQYEQETKEEAKKFPVPFAEALSYLRRDEKGENSFFQVRGLNQSTLRLSFEDSVLGLAYDQEKRSFLIFQSRGIKIFDENFQFEDFLGNQDIDGISLSNVAEIEQEWRQERLLIAKFQRNQESFTLTYSFEGLRKIKFKRGGLQEVDLKLDQQLKKFLETDQLEFIQKDSQIVVKINKEDELKVMKLELIDDDLIITKNEIELKSNAQIKGFLSQNSLILKYNNALDDCRNLLMRENFAQKDLIQDSVSNSYGDLIVSTYQKQRKSVLLCLNNTRNFKKLLFALNQDQIKEDVILNFLPFHFLQTSSETQQNLYGEVGIQDSKSQNQILQRAQFLSENSYDPSQRVSKQPFAPISSNPQQLSNFDLLLQKQKIKLVEKYLELNKFNKATDSSSHLLPTNFESFEKIVQLTNFDEYNSGIFETLPSIEVENLKKQDKKISTWSATTKLSEEFIKDYIGDKVEEPILNSHSIEVKRINLSLLSQKQGLLKFMKFLNQPKNEAYLKNQCFQIVIQEIWDKTFYGVLVSEILPYLISFSFLLYYLTLCFSPNKPIEELEYTCFLIYGIIRLINFVIFCLGKMRKISFWLLFDMIQFVVICALFCLLINESNSDAQYILAAFSVILLWYKWLSFLRMHKGTSNFIKLILVVFSDLKNFLIIFVIALIGLAHCIFILDQATVWFDPKASQIGGSSIYERMMFVYRQAMGDLQLEHYDKAYKPGFYWFLFLASSLLIQIVLFNVLIAIIGDTYNRLKETENENQMKELCGVICDYYFYVPEKEIRGKPYLFIVTPENMNRARKMEETQEQLQDQRNKNQEQNRIQNEINQNLREFLNYMRSRENQEPFAQNQLLP